MRKLSIFALILIAPSLLSAYISPGSPAGFVNDFAGLLQPRTISDLNKILSQFESQTGNEISVVTVSTHGTDETIESYASKLFEEWGIGKEKEDNGLLLIVAKDDREMRIEVGYGLEPEVTDIESSYIIRDVLAPAFQAGDFDLGIRNAVQAIIVSISGEIKSETRMPTSVGDWSGFFIFILFFIISILGRSKSWWFGGLLGLVAGVLIGVFVSLTAGIISTIILVPVGLFIDYVASKNAGKNDGPHGPWFFGGGGHGGGFGGFGGGMSGGGGSSGRW
ncbi:MAG: uncharacterized protein AB200_03165 [Parcubacteria bacterium C7867-005]|nr:MAG: uncharacterized protein AB200_03165 [Parcubacteria bacterium C7867-005]